MSFCEKFNCGYWWQEDGESYPRCHYEGADGTAPCEVDDDEE